MPRKYIRKPGTRSYRNYSLAKIEEAVTECVEGKIKLGAAAKKYGIPISTLGGHLKVKRQSPDDPTVQIKKPGRPTVFTTEEEKLMSAHMIARATYGFPVTKSDLKVIIKSYLEKLGRRVSVFTNNSPGDDWIDLFMKRHPNISHEGENQTIYRKALSDSFVDHFKTIHSVSERPRKRILATPADDINIAEKSPTNKVSAKKKKINEKKGKNKKTIQDNQSETSESDDCFSLNETDNEDDSQVQPSTFSPTPLPTLGEKQLTAGEYVYVTFCGKRYPGKIIQEDGGKFEVTCMTKFGKWWTWPENEDNAWFYPRSIVRRIPVPKPVRVTKLMFSVNMKG